MNTGANYNRRRGDIIRDGSDADRDGKMTLVRFNLRDAINSLRGNYVPETLAKVDGFSLKMMECEGEFPWHHHDHDTLFLVHRGSLVLETEDGTQEFNTGDIGIVPAWTIHRIVADTRTIIMMLETSNLITIEDSAPKK